MVKVHHTSAYSDHVEFPELTARGRYFCQPNDTIIILNLKFSLGLYVLET